MPKLAEIVEMFSRFGFREDHVRQALASGDSAYNAFEGLKLALQVRWNDMCQELPVDRQRELRVVYNRLQRITMKSRTTKSDKERENKKRVSDLFDGLRNRMGAFERRSGEAFISQVRDHLRKCKKDGKLDAAGEARARAAGLFADDEEI